MFTQHKTSNNKKVNISMPYRLQIQIGTKIMLQYFDRNLELKQVCIDFRY